MKELKLITRARAHGKAVAIRAGSEQHSYTELLDRSAALASAICGDALDLREARVAFLAPAGFDYVTTQWAIWRSGGVCVPLCLSAAEPELEYALSDSRSSLVVATRQNADKVRSICERLRLPLLIVEEVATAPEKDLPEISPDRRGMILYTSGTTSKPKGVVTTHANIQAQIESLIIAW